MSEIRRGSAALAEVSVAPAAGTDLAATVALQRHGAAAEVSVGGQITAMTRRHLDDWLDWLITDGVRQVTVTLEAAEGPEAPLSGVFMVARARLAHLQGHLTVISAAAGIDRSPRTAGRPARPRRAQSVWRVEDL